MSLLTTSAVIRRARRVAPTNFSASSVLQEQMKKQAAVQSHDIFLSHAFDDRELILGVTLTLEDLGYSVHVDWRDDPSLDRRNVNSATAERLRARLKTSKCLFYATTENAGGSKWMPWELGFKDGHNRRAAILPIQETTQTAFRGQEVFGYLSLCGSAAGHRLERPTRDISIGDLLCCFRRLARGKGTV